MKVFSYDNNDFTEIQERSELLSNDYHTFLLFEKDMKKLKKLERSAIYDLMEKFVDSYLASDSFRENSMLNELLIDLEKKYKLETFPYHIECTDISHLSWGWISGWLSCFKWWIPYKKHYRRYKIQSVKESEGYSNDYKSLKEIILRRFLITKTSGSKDKTATKKTDLFPDLFIIDWGKGQLWIVKELIKKYPELKEVMKKTQFVALGKWEARHSKWRTSWAAEVIYSLDNKLNIIWTPLTYDQTDKILIKIRDEAHRFANQYRKKRMSMEWK